MSRAFVREDDFDAAPPERSAPTGPVYVTPAGLASLQARLGEVNVALAALATASEDPQTALRRETLAREQRYLSARVVAARAVSPPPNPVQVSFGCCVSIEDDDGAREVRIVGEDEVDVAAGRIAWSSPLARALSGARVGDVVLWERPAGTREVKVTAIRGC